MLELIDAVEKMLKEAGALNVEFYTLINNDGFNFTINGARYDLRHLRNIYGASVNYFRLYHRADDKNAEFLKELERRANDLLEQYGDD